MAERSRGQRPDRPRKHANGWGSANTRNIARSYTLLTFSSSVEPSSLLTFPPQGDTISVFRACKQAIFYYVRCMQCLHTLTCTAYIADVTDALLL